VQKKKGVLLALLEKIGVIEAFDGGVSKNLSAGTVAAGWQNFIICIEMFFAAIALRFAFPYSVYVNCTRGGVMSQNGRVVTMQSISSNLKETMNPQDIMHDAIHNFHPQYQHYTQYNPQVFQTLLLGLGYSLTFLVYLRISSFSPFIFQTKYKYHS
jgi:hypothetical protein